MNLNLSGTITLRSSLAHGAFEPSATVVPFRRDKIVQRNADGTVAMDEYALAVVDQRQREELRQYAQRLLRIVWQSRSDGYGWSYQQLADRVGAASRMTTSLGDLTYDVLTHMGASHPNFFGKQEDMEYFDRVIGAADSSTLLSLLRENGERMLVVTRMQSEALARYEKREIPQNQPTLLATQSATNPVKPRSLPSIARVPVYSGNALRNGLGRRNAARFILERFGWRVPLDAFRVMFAGGSLQKGAKDGLSIGERVGLLTLMPMYGLFGGALMPGSMIEGVAKVGKCYPLVREALGVLPPALREEAEALSMRDIVTTETVSRREDALMLTSKYLSAQASPLNNNSMIVERETLIPGTRLWSSWGLYQTTPLQIGALVSAFVEFAKHPTLGAAAQQGHGRADIEYSANGDMFLSLQGGELALGALARESFDEYQTHIDARKGEIQNLLGATDLVNLDAPPVNVSTLQSEMENEEGDE